jgi:endonuclease/exonuclease/phosphatase family metal-dependent hydrolase
MDAVHKVIAAEPRLCLVGLQEVIPQLANALFPKLKSLGYRIFQQPGAFYGVAVAVHPSLSILESGWIPYTDTIMARGFVFVRVQLPNSNREVLFATTHLESFQRMPGGRDYTGTLQRVAQIQEFEAFCKDQQSRHANLKTIIFNGDLNWDDERQKSLDPPMMTCVDKSVWQDCFLAVRKNKERGYTYDGKENPMLNNSLRRRFDRFLVQGCAVQGVRIVGTEAIEGETCDKYNEWKKSYKTMPLAPSDHFGVIADLIINLE